MAAILDRQVGEVVLNRHLLLVGGVGRRDHHRSAVLGDNLLQRIAAADLELLVADRDSLQRIAGRVGHELRQRQHRLGIGVGGAPAVTFPQGHERLDQQLAARIGLGLGGDGAQRLGNGAGLGRQDQRARRAAFLQPAIDLLAVALLDHNVLPQRIVQQLNRRRIGRRGRGKRDAD